ncbi:MAG TPA: biotin/lipoyl-containing protein [Candidatus Binataceae bacterium]|nr:biotin/lipoyl-containing protein [Candidatus Binataceae bacterium]
MRYVATIDGAEHELEIEEVTGHSLRITLGDSQFEADVRRAGHSAFSIIVGDRAFDLEVSRQADELVVGARGIATRVTLQDTARRARRASTREHAGGRVELKAMMPGRVVNLLVKVGDDVVAQQGVVVVEAMKMENELKSPKAGKVTEIKVAAGQTVEKGELLLIIE